MKKLIFTFVFLLLAGSSQARIIYVDNDRPADFNNIQAAIDDSNDGDTIIVADGTYTGDGNRDISFFGKAIILQSENGPEKCIIDCNATQDDQHYGFGFGWGEDSNSVLEGFTIINGWVMGSCGMFLCEYGGILCANSGPTIDNCIIRSNVGYAVYCLNSDVIIKNCTISENKWSLNSSGVYCTNSNLKISNCIVSGNKGRGISCFSSSVMVSKCTISDNNEEAGGDGGGIFCGSSHATISYCTIRGNKGNFGGIGFDRTSGTISSCVISRNSGGGITCYGNSPVKIDSCVIKGNTGFFGGGGIGCSDCCSATIINCTIVNNHVRHSGGGIYCYWSYAKISNSILWANSTESEGPQIALRTMGWPSWLTISFCDVQGGETAAYVEPECTLNWGEGNIDADPCFAEANNGDYHLKSQAGRWDPNGESWVQDNVTSPGIDAGDPMSPIGPEPFPNGGRINMGAYGGTVEASKSYFGKSLCKTILAGDVNGDCRINYLDFRLMALHWLEDKTPVPPQP